VRSYLGNSVGGDWFKENVTLASRIARAWSALNRQTGEEGSKTAWAVGPGKAAPERESTARCTKGRHKKEKEKEREKD
jgi:hypothetical protein